VTAADFRPARSYASNPSSTHGQCVVGFLEIRADSEDSAVDAGLRFSVKVWAVIEGLEHEPLVDTVDHCASLLASGVEAEVHQNDEAPSGDKVPLAASAPVAGGSLAR
jgi:hypothetical protein